MSAEQKSLDDGAEHAVGISRTSARSAGMPSSSSRLAPWCGLLLAVMAATWLVYGVDIVWRPLPSAVSGFFQNFASWAIFLGAAALCVMKGRAARDERSAWWFLALTMFLYAAGQAYYAFAFSGVTDVPYPSPADGFWLLFYLPAYRALYEFLRKRAGSISRGVLLDALVGGLGVGGAGAALVFQVVRADTGGSAAAVATNLAYPLGDLGLLALVAAAITATGWRASGVWRWIAGAFAIFAVSDSVYLLQVAHGSYVPGRLIDLGWPAAAVVVGLAAWLPEPRVPAGVRAAGTIGVPAVCGLAALVLLVFDHYVRTNELALGLAAASILVILVRLYLTLHDNLRMLVRSRLEATTDALTGLGNRRQLTADLSVHIDQLDPAQPLMLTLFDLDGFKLYNDTFGHVPGDQLLERLGARLAETVEGRGTAYRMGGDEFCAIWSKVDADRASLIALEALAALSEHGEAFSIGCSHGSVLLPTDTSDPTEALRIADRRMYIGKRSGRDSAGRQSSDVLLRALAERDSELGIHQGGVAALACATAMRLGLPEEEIEATRQTALLHDVGKVAIPDEILNKPGPLDDAEWAFVRRHTIIAERIIGAAPSLVAVAKLVRSTHERYDGSGYPDRLTGAEIPLIARIVAVCDAYDAMVFTRAYRDARGASAAIAELRGCAGTQFDPEVVEAFVDALAAVNDYGRDRDYSLA